MKPYENRKYQYRKNGLKQWVVSKDYQATLEYFGDEISIQELINLKVGEHLSMSPDKEIIREEKS